MTQPLISIDNIHKSYLMGKEAVPALRGELRGDRPPQPLRQSLRHG